MWNACQLWNVRWVAGKCIALQCLFVLLCRLQLHKVVSILCNAKVPGLHCCSSIAVMNRLQPQTESFLYLLLGWYMWPTYTTRRIRHCGTWYGSKVSSWRMSRQEGSLKETKDSEQNKKLATSTIYNMDFWHQTDQSCKIVSIFTMHKPDGNGAHSVSKGCKKL